MTFLSKSTKLRRLLVLGGLIPLVAAIIWSATQSPLPTPQPAEETVRTTETGELLPFTGEETSAAEAGDQVGIFGLFEISVNNSKNYSNPFDYREIELQGRFTSPSGKSYDFFGFYDGDGNGGLNGNVWKLRFMPDELGAWKYSYSWTDNTPGDSGNFNVVDTGIPGPLRIAKDNSWYFEDARGRPFDWRGYSLHRHVQDSFGRGLFTRQAWQDVQEKINQQVADMGYNAVMHRLPVITKGGAEGEPATDNNGNHFWQQNGAEIDFTRFNIPQWGYVEDTLEEAARRGVYIFHFSALVDQFSPRPAESQLPTYLRYLAARLGPYWNQFGYSAVWEYQDIMSIDDANYMMNLLAENLQGLPQAPVLSIHDHSNNKFTGWMDFSMRQNQSKTIFEGNCRTCGQHGGVDSSFVNKPILGSEDVWQYEDGGYGQPRNAVEVRRGIWGIMMAGVLPVFMEDTRKDGRYDATGEPDVIRVYDFFYSQTNYRKYEMLNGLVSKRAEQIASGIAGEEYLVYDQNGGTISVNLSDSPRTATFATLWYDPESGKKICSANVNGGGTRRLSSPFNEDSVLLLIRTGAKAVEAVLGPIGGDFLTYLPTIWNSMTPQPDKDRSC